MHPGSFRLIFGLLALATTALAQPAFRANAVYKPTFLTGYTSLTAGTGYIAKISDRVVFLTAFHLFGPAAGLEKDLTPAEAKDFASALAASSMTDPSHVVVSSEMLLIPSAKAFSDQDASHDVAAFLLESYNGTPLVIAAAMPAVGDRVYLFARPRGEDQLRFLAATVRQATPRMVKYVFDEAGANLAGTSGAPVLNEMGEVVAMNLGGGTAGDREYGFGSPAATFSKIVSDAMAADSAKQP